MKIIHQTPPSPAVSSETEAIREILRRVRRIEIRSRRTVHDVMAGEYHSVFKGRGMEFDEVREYAPGDEIRDIDWNVTARTGRPFVKRYVEEREQTVFFVVDVSASGAFGTGRRMKGEIAAEICAVLAFSAVQNNDRVGLITFSDRIEELIPPKKGRNHVLRVIRELLFARPEGRGTDLALALDTLVKVLKRRAIVFLVSDFLTPDVRRPLMIANRRHDLVAVRVGDPRETVLPPAGIIAFEDAETGEAILVDTSDRRVRERFEEFNERRGVALDRLMQSLGIDNIAIRTEGDYLEPLVRFFRLRAKRR
ncbi:DUF58 domain-containing protein [Candidatus Sumerlaeota bacterium]|nr:DUF58 domain-containing protein [Candidatus Sumerlaeota bacterium]